MVNYLVFFGAESNKCNASDLFVDSRAILGRVFSKYISSCFHGFPKLPDFARQIRDITARVSQKNPTVGFDVGQFFSRKTEVYSFASKKFKKVGDESANLMFWTCYRKSRVLIR